MKSEFTEALKVVDKMFANGLELVEEHQGVPLLDAALMVSAAILKSSKLIALAIREGGDVRLKFRPGCEWGEIHAGRCESKPEQLPDTMMDERHFWGLDKDYARGMIALPK